MIKEGNADSKWSEKKMEEEDSVKTVDCLRGRLLAERMASRNAKEEAEQLANKLIELENLLKEEAKSRNKAERKLKILIKKLESKNIFYVSDESEWSGLVDKSEFSSPSSNASSSSTKSLEEKGENQESKEGEKFSKGSYNLQQNDSPISVLHPSYGDSSTTEGSLNSVFQVEFPEFEGPKCEMGSSEDQILPTLSENLKQNVAEDNKVEEDSLTSAAELKSGKPSKVESNQGYNDSNSDEQSVESPTEEGPNQKYDQDPNNNVDNSMALVPVDTPQKNYETIDPEVLDASVKEVLEALRHAKEQLQSSMEKRRTNMIRVG